MRRLFVLFAVCVFASRADGQQIYLPPQELPAVESETTMSDVVDPMAAMRKSNPVLWQEYQALQSGSPAAGPAGGCGCGSGGCGLGGCGAGGLPYYRCGCNPQLFPWIGGPGNCDSWCVGPKWHVVADSMIMSRDNADWDLIVADVGIAADLLEQFDHALGGRVFVTGYNCQDFGMQIGWEGINDWHATAFFPQAGALETFDYESRLNSVEVNFLPRVPWPVKFFAGFRYIEVDENFLQFTANSLPPIPPPSDPPAAPIAVLDNGTSFLLQNRLVGFQMGGLRDSWQFNRWISFEGFANAGVYCNLLKRENVARTVTTIVTGDDISTPEDEASVTSSEIRSTTRQDFDEISMAAEAGITAITRLTQCVALRGGYQVLVVDGVGEGMDAYFGPDLASSTLLYHGLQFGLEYRR